MAISDLPYLHAAGDGGPRPTTQVVVIHATDNTAPATAEAGYATRRPDLTSAHFYADETVVIRSLPLDHIAYGCLWHGNRISVQIELCGRSNQISDATLRCAAPIVAEVCRVYGLPIRKLTAADVAAGAHGICGHAEITAAFPQDGGDHTDPGAAFPWARFLDYVRAADQAPDPHIESAAAATEEDDMAVGMLPPGFAYDEHGNLIDPSKIVVVPFEDANRTLGPVVLSFATDHMAAGHLWQVRAASGDNTGHPYVYKSGQMVLKGGQPRDWTQVPDGHTWCSFGRRKVDADDTEDSQPIGWSVARYPKF